ncbi:hypothetical protein BgiMline_014519, partial [Biomphalaria glabrata]
MVSCPVAAETMYGGSGAAASTRPLLLTALPGLVLSQAELSLLASICSPGHR